MATAMAITITTITSLIIATATTANIMAIRKAKKENANTKQWSRK